MRERECVLESKMEKERGGREGGRVEKICGKLLKKRKKKGGRENWAAIYFHCKHFSIRKCASSSPEQTESRNISSRHLSERWKGKTGLGSRDKVALQSFFITDGIGFYHLGLLSYYNYQ